MRIRLSDPNLVPDLLEFLDAPIDVVASRSSDDTIDVAILGSRCHAANVDELETRLREWLAANPTAEARVEAA